MARALATFSPHHDVAGRLWAQARVHCELSTRFRDLSEPTSATPLPRAATNPSPRSSIAPRNSLISFLHLIARDVRSIK